MSPLVANRLAAARQNFDGQIIVVKDLGDAAIVLIVPTERDGNDDVDGDWKRVTEPTFMLIDPSRKRDGPPQ